MNTQNVLATITITALLAFATGYATGQQNDGKFTIHKTRSGMFNDYTTYHRQKIERS